MAIGAENENAESSSNSIWVCYVHFVNSWKKYEYIFLPHPKTKDLNRYAGGAMQNKQIGKLGPNCSHDYYIHFCKSTFGYGMDPCLLTYGLNSRTDYLVISLREGWLWIQGCM